MANLLLETETQTSVEERIVHVGDRPIPFERFLEIAEGRYLDLVDGIVLERPMIQLDHERCSRWIYQVVGAFVQKRDLGEMLSSRIMVKIDGFGGRMPDLLFVQKHRMDIVQQKAVYGAPDLVIEIVSPNDHPSDLRALETDYFGLGVPELVFIDLVKREIRQLQRQSESYAEAVITAGRVVFTTLPGMELQADWILKEPRPDVFDTLSGLFAT